MSDRKDRIMALLLGIDLGTSSIKSVLFDLYQAKIVATAAQEYSIDKPLPDRAEQDPEVWWQATVETVRRVTGAADRNRVAAISFSGQMHGALLLDAHGQPLHPAIIWADQRSAEACQTLIETVGAERYAAIAGTLPATGFMGATLVWLAHHQPDLLDQTYKVIFPKDYLRLRLTGQIATDVSDAAGSGVFDIRRRQWADSILTKVGLPVDRLPEPLPSTAVAGLLTPSAAEVLGLPAGIPVVAGCADQPAQAIGNGLIRPGQASVTTGSGGQVFTPIRLDPTSGQTDPRLHVFNHAVPELWYILGAILSAGLSLRWLRDLTGLPPSGRSYAILSAEASAVPPGAEGLIFLPYLSGERTPHMDPLARGGFIGLTHFHQRGHLARAVMEGVAMALRQALELSLSLGGQVDMIIAAGGGAESDVWRQIQADVLGLPMRQSLLTEQAGLGAALLAGVGAGLYADLDEACAQVVQYGPPTQPDPDRHARYNQLYERFTQLYPRLQTDFHWLTTFNST
ncbi:MAG: xylulokinase [Anaerolineaceae bacterium]|nr:xylulokinase [Anaerolineaceae bacterium]MCB9099855.1 xylulokinase [Anaerolineales bacterium]